jgi:hypothetical protein
MAEDTMTRETGSLTGSCPLCGETVGVAETREDGSYVLEKCRKRSGEHANALSTTEIAAPEVAAVRMERETGTDVDA